MSKNSLRRQVQRAYSQNALTRICTLREDRFGRAFGMQTVQVDQQRPHNYYHFKDNNSSVLAVAHLDTVVPQAGRTPHFFNTEKGPLINSGALDDRLGAYVILDLLPKLGITCDWLLTVGEESGQSTAELFEPDKKYDWVIEFDRSGTDVVMYQYDDEISRIAVEASGAKMGNGSYSDIAYLEHLGVKAFNWGVGYQGNYHSVNGYAYLNDTFAMVAQYLRFTEQNAGTVMPHESHSWKDDDDWYRDYLKDTRYDLDGAYDCPFCERKATVDPCTLICSGCYICLDCKADVADCQCFVPSKSGDPTARLSTSGARLTSDEALRAEGERRIQAITAETSMFNAGVITGQLPLPAGEKLPAIGDAAKANAAEHTNVNA